MRMPLILGFLLAAASTALVSAQGYDSPPPGARAAPGPRVQLERLRADIAWADYVLGSNGGNDLVIDLGSPIPAGGRPLIADDGALSSRFMPMSRRAMMDSLNAAVASGQIRRDQMTAVISQWMQRANVARERLELMREQMRRDERDLIARTQPPLKPWEVGRPPAPSAPPAGGGVPGAWRVFGAVPQQPSTTFQGNRVASLTVDTDVFDRTPYRMTGDFSGTVSVPPGGRVVLAGDRSGRGSWSIDNFVYIEIGDRSFVAGMTADVADGGGTVQMLGGSGAPLDLTQYFRPGVPTRIRVMALDYGGVGHVSEVWLVVTGGR